MTHSKTYELKMSDQAFSALRREVRAARLRLKRDMRLGLEAPLRVVQLSEIQLPPIVRQFRLAPDARSLTAGRASDTFLNRRSAYASLTLGLPLSSGIAETPQGGQLVLDEGIKARATPAEWPEASRGHLGTPDLPIPADSQAKLADVEGREVEHSGNVTLYLPKDLSRWMTEQHKTSRLSYPALVLNAISWAVEADRLSEIFSSDETMTPVGDLFGRAVGRNKQPSGSAGAETRSVRFRKDHMRVIIGLAGTWTAGNRNAFFVGVLSAYRQRERERSA